MLPPGKKEKGSSALAHANPSLKEPRAPPPAPTLPNCERTWTCPIIARAPGPEAAPAAVAPAALAATVVATTPTTTAPTAAVTWVANTTACALSIVLRVMLFKFDGGEDRGGNREGIAFVPFRGVGVVASEAKLADSSVGFGDVCGIGISDTGVL